MSAPRPWSRTNRLIVAAAEALGVGAEAVGSEHSDFFMRLVWADAPEGRRSALISKTRSPFLTEVAQTLSNHKQLAKELLAGRGLPVVPGELFDERSAPGSDAVAADRARALLARWGELVVKPNWGNRGLGVVSGVSDFDALVAAFAHAQACDRDEEVLIEPRIPGTNLRALVIGGRFMAAAELPRVALRGDGQRSVREQIAELNEDPRRSSWREPALTALDEIEADSVAARLEATGAGWTLDSVLPKGAAIELSSEEAEVIDRSEELHVGWRELAVEAAKALGVDVAGVDIRGRAEELFGGPPSAAEGAGILELNALPALHLHALPTRGEARPVFEAFVAYCLQLPGAPEPCAVVRV